MQDSTSSPCRPVRLAVCAAALMTLLAAALTVAPPAFAGPAPVAPPATATTAPTPAPGTVKSRSFTTDAQAQAFFRIANLRSNKCLVTQGFANGARAFQYTCLKYADQFWQLEDAGDGSARIRNQHSGRCLVVQGFANGARAFQYSCLSFVDQHWDILVDATGDFAMLQNRHSGKCLVVQGFANGASAFQYTCHPEFADQWWYQPI